MKHVFCSIWALLAFICFLTSCSSDSAEESTYERYNVSMSVTNNVGEDLIQTSNKYYPTLNEFRFDTWEIYLDGKLIQTANDGNKYAHRQVYTLQENNATCKGMILNSTLEIQKQININAEKHVAEYVISSVSLFGDTKEHTIRMEFWNTKNDFGYYSSAEYTITVDGVKQEVYYPGPNSQYKSIKEPHFVLNVDAL